MSTEETSTATGNSYYPVIVSSLSLIIFFVYQAVQIGSQQTAVNKLSAQLEDVRSNTIPRYEDAASKNRQVEGVLSSLAGDIYKLATVDKDELAMKIVAAHHIQSNTPPGGTAPAGAAPQQ